MKPVTTKELAIYTFIKSYALQHNYLPSIREIGAGVGIKSTSDVHRRLERLEDLGYIERTGEPRAYRVKGLRYVEDRAN